MKKHAPGVVFTKRDLGITGRPHQCKRFLAIFVCISLGSYLIIDLNIKSKLNDLKDRFDFTTKPALLYNASKAYFVDTEGCKMPSFNIIDEKISEFMERASPINCDKPLTAVKDNKIIVNMNKMEIRDIYNITDVDKITCTYKEFNRDTDRKNVFRNETVYFNLLEGAKVSGDFAKVECISANNETFYKDYHYLIYERNKTGKEALVNKDPNKISLMVIGIDSVSRLNFLRQMNTSATLVRENFNAVEFFGYNKVGDNTYPNLVPVLSGLDENELSLACLQQRTNVSYDGCSFIWKRFKEIGFKTVFSEDVAEISLFNYFRKGFNKQPTDFYIRPLILELERNIASKKKGNVHLCLGGRQPTDVIFEHITNLIPQFQKEHFFSFFWSSSVTHDFFNMPQLIDEDFAQLLITLNTTNVLNHTILFVMSDHGLRWGSFRKTYQGMMEDRQPFLYMILPQWFSDIYPAAAANLRQNTNKLTTHFDLHATFLDLVNLSSISAPEIRRRSIELLDTEPLPRGISLFLPVPKTRTCDSASIASHWCTCHEKQEISTNDARVQRVARFVVKNINDKLQPYPQCRGLFLNSILEANLASSNQNITKDIKSDFLTDITIRLQTKPGLGEFEATVRISSSSIILTGTISRTNLYGKQSYCIDNYLLKMYCFCDR